MKTFVNVNDKGKIYLTSERSDAEDTAKWFVITGKPFIPGKVSSNKLYVLNDATDMSRWTEYAHLLDKILRVVDTNVTAIKHGVPEGKTVSKNYLRDMVLKKVAADFINYSGLIEVDTLNDICVNYTSWKSILDKPNRKALKRIIKIAMENFDPNWIPPTRTYNGHSAEITSIQKCTMQFSAGEDMKAKFKSHTSDIDKAQQAKKAPAKSVIAVASHMFQIFSDKNFAHPTESPEDFEECIRNVLGTFGAEPVDEIRFDETIDKINKAVVSLNECFNKSGVKPDFEVDANGLGGFIMLGAIPYSMDFLAKDIPYTSREYDAFITASDLELAATRVFGRRVEIRNPGYVDINRVCEIYGDFKKCGILFPSLDGAIRRYVESLTKFVYETAGLHKDLIKTFYPAYGGAQDE